MKTEAPVWEERGGGRGRRHMARPVHLAPLSHSFNLPPPSHRCIDCVTVKGSEQPVGLFTYDLDLTAIEIAEPLLGGGSSCGAARAVGTKGAVDARARADADVGDADVGDAEAEAEAVAADDAAQSARIWAEYDDEWAQSEDLVSTWGADADFLQLFGEGFSAYRNGRWGQARDAFERTLYRAPQPRRSRGTAGDVAAANAGGGGSISGEMIEDGPSRVLLQHMAGYDYVAPKGWAGHRALTEK
eukprot:354023-Chlamydomonas_euryale.AAC.2